MHKLVNKIISLSLENRISLVLYVKDCLYLYYYVIYVIFIEQLS
jgi:hypothetical protein